MSVLINGNVNDIKVSAIHSDEKLGTWWAVGTERGWVEIRTTRTGQMRIGEFNKGQHPYFTIEIKDTKSIKEQESEHKPHKRNKT